MSNTTELKSMEQYRLNTSENIMNDQYMSIDDIRDLLGDPVYYPPEVIGMIAERVANINAADLAHKITLTIQSQFISYNVLDRSLDNADASAQGFDISPYIIKLGASAPVDCTKELLDMYNGLEEWNA